MNTLIPPANTPSDPPGLGAECPSRGSVSAPEGRIGPVRKGPTGFSILELIIVITITGVLALVVVGSFSRMAGELNTRSAHDNFLGLHAQARAFAVERGVEVRFVIDAAGNRAWVETTQEGQVRILNELRFGEAFSVELTRSSGEGLANVCFTPMGIANLSCTNAISSATTFRFQMGNRSRGVQLLPLGQARTI